MRSFVVALSVGSGAGILVFWTVALSTHRVPEQGKPSIWFHIVAELLAALLLVGGGLALLATPASWASVLVAAGLGALFYSSVNSPGYYADLRQTTAVWLFMVLAVVTMLGILYALALA